MTTGRRMRSAVGIAAAAALVITALAAPAGAAQGGVTVKPDVTYRTVDGEQLGLDVYRPAKKGQNRLAAGVSWSGPMDFVSLAPAAATNAGRSIRTFLGCLPDACPDTYAAASPVTHVDKTDSPMLIVNSTMELVPQSQADAMKAALDKAGVANQAIILPGTRHSRAYSDDVWNQTVAFLENYLKK